MATIAIMRCDGGLSVNRSGFLNKSLGISLKKQRAVVPCADFNDSTSESVSDISRMDEAPNYKAGSKKNPSERRSSPPSFKSFDVRKSQSDLQQVVMH
jgi:hypothetical protein